MSLREVIILLLSSANKVKKSSTPIWVELVSSSCCVKNSRILALGQFKQLRQKVSLLYP